MKVSKNIMGVAAGALLAVGFAGSASAHNVDGITFAAGSTFTIGTVFEDYVAAPGDTLSGIGEVTTIFAPDHATHTWDSGDNNRELTFVFDNFILEAAVPIVGGFQLLFSGGSAQFYSDAAQNFTTNSGQAADLASATDGNLWLDVSAGNSYGNCTTLVGAGVCVSGDATEITLLSTITGSGLSTFSSGDGHASFDVTGAGLADAIFDTDGLNGFDITADFSFNSVANADYDLSGSVNATLLAVPEPAALGLFGIGLIGLGALARRRKTA